jgi:hypothetical protein
MRCSDAPGTEDWDTCPALAVEADRDICIALAFDETGTHVSLWPSEIGTYVSVWVFESRMGSAVPSMNLF